MLFPQKSSLSLDLLGDLVASLEVESIVKIVIKVPMNIIRKESLLEMHQLNAVFQISAEWGTAFFI